MVAVADAVLGIALGLFVSAFAQTEFQAVQFMPAVVVPQILLCGLFVPRDQLPDVLEAISNVLPLSYAVDAMQTLAATVRHRRRLGGPRHRRRLRGRGPRPRCGHAAAAYALSDGRRPDTIGRMPDNPWDDITPMAPGDVMIHIGPPKTGSTSIQTTMAARRDELAELGVLYPGRVCAPSSRLGRDGRPAARDAHARMVEWDNLVTEVNASGLQAVVSSEAFGRADDDAVAGSSTSFGADRIHVVAIGRRLDKTLPSLYQEKVKKYLAKTSRVAD